VTLAFAVLAGSTPARTSTPRSAFVLLADGTLMKVSLPGARTQSRARLEAPPGQPGHYLAFSPDRTKLYALSTAGPVTRVSTATLGGRIRSEIPSPSSRPPGVVEYRALAVGPRTGNAYVFANRVLPSAAGASLFPIQYALVDTLDRDLRRTAEVTVRDTGYDWRVYRGTVARAEDRIFVSYHGTTTTGADSVDTAGRRRGCGEPARANEGCLGVHGNVEPVGNGVVGTTGEGPLRRFDASGRVVAEIDPRLPRNHVMEFTVAAGRRAYVLGSCLYSGGLSVVDLVGRRARVVVRPGRGKPAGVCGERIAVAEPYLAVAAPGRLLVVDGRTGTVLHSLRLRVQPVDVVVR
jgi:hypothetical protein